MSLVWKTLAGSTTTTANVNQEIKARLTFEDLGTVGVATRNDVRAIYIDWDDGESNDKSEANYQWVTLSEPKTRVDVKHTYNKSGTFNPVIQTINSQGIASRYYSNESSSDVKPHTQKAEISGVVVSDTKATGIMRVENTTVKSGIDNSIFQKEGPKLIYAICAPTLTSTEMGYAGTIKLELEMEIASSTTHTTNLTGGKVSSGFSTVIKKQTVLLGTPASKTGLESFIGQGESVNRVLSVKYLNPKLTGDDANDYTKNAALNNLKIFIVAIGDDDLIYPITYVTAGSPIKKAEDRDRFITMDFSQSRAAASNVDPKYYFYDNGKGWFSVEDWAESSSKFTNATRQTNSTRQVNYTYLPRPDGIGGYANTGATGKFTRPFGTGATDSNAKWIYESAQAERTNQFAVDDFGRFYDTYHLVRNSMEPSSSASNVSSISGNKVTIARITPIINFTASASESGTKFDITGTSTVFTADYTTAAFDNVESNSGRVSLSGCNTQQFQDGGSSPADRNSNEYLIALWDAKTNKIFFQCTPQAQELMSNASGGTNQIEIGGLYYLHADKKDAIDSNIYWKPLMFQDGTKSTIEYRNTTDDTYSTTGASFSKSGFIEFDEPLDWSAVSMYDLMGKNSDYSGWGNAEGSAVSATPTANNFEFKITATCSATGTTTQGKTATFVRTGDTWPTALSGNTDGIGAYKYLAVLHSGNMVGPTANAGAAYWVADGFDDGYDGTNTFKLQIGDNLFWGGGAPSVYGKFITTSETYVFTFRRINWYDVIDGASKVWSSNPTGAAANAFKVNPVDSKDGGTWLNYFSFMSGSAAGAAMDSKWGNNDYYVLKMVLKGNKYQSGSTSSSPATGSGAGVVGTEVWNILPYDNSFSQFVEEIDDHAYSLN